MIRLLFLICWIAFFVDGLHFNGGSISWYPTDPSTNSSPVIVTIIQTYTWTLSAVNCDQNVPISTPSRVNENNNLTCIGNCSNSGNYANSIINILTDCISTSSPINLMKSEKSKNVTLDIDCLFTIAYQDSSWRSLANSAGVYWSIVSLINLRRRPDGLLNSSPISNVQSPQYVIVNQTTLIHIPTFDRNSQDHIRCRWANKSGFIYIYTILVFSFVQMRFSFFWFLRNIDECAGVCYSNKLPNGTNLTDCTLTFTGTSSGVWYAIALQVEDFFDSTSLSPMSSIPIQFLIYVLPIPTCIQVPIILPIDHCFIVQTDSLQTLTLVAFNPCQTNKTILTEISITMHIQGMNSTRLINSTTNSSLSYKIFNWIPTNNQIGLQHLCAIAYTKFHFYSFHISFLIICLLFYSEMTQSQEYCVTFNVTSSNSSSCQLTTTTTTATITTTAITTTTITSTTITTTAITINTTTTPSMNSTTSSKEEEKENKNREKINIPLVVGLSLLALLFSVCCCCCCCCWCYYYHHWYKTIRRQHPTKRIRQRNRIYQSPNCFLRSNQSSFDFIQVQNNHHLPRKAKKKYLTKSISSGRQSLITVIKIKRLL